MAAFVPRLQWRASTGVLLWRVIIGLGFTQHGWPKMHHPSSWMTLAMGSHAFAPPWLQAVVTVVEFFGGIALVLGLLTPLAAFALGVDMATALLKVHFPMGAHWVGGPGAFEVPLFYFVSMIALLFTGPGMYSIDALLAGRRPLRGAARWE